MVITAAALAVVSTSASARGRGLFGNGYNDGRGDGDFDGGISMNFSGRGYGYGYGYRHPYYSCGYAPYGYAPVTAPVALQAGTTARELTLLAVKEKGAALASCPFYLQGCNV